MPSIPADASNGIVSTFDIGFDDLSDFDTIFM